MSDRTYAEVSGHAPFDWNKWLDAAIKKTPSEDECEAMVQKAGAWTTCACGNMCAIIPRKGDPSYWQSGEPVDSALMSLGMWFYDCIKTKRWGRAKEVLAKIEARSTILIQEELAKLNQR